MDPTLTSRCTHLLCESQVSNMYAQVSQLGTCTAACFHFILERQGCALGASCLDCKYNVSYYVFFMICDFWGTNFQSVCSRLVPENTKEDAMRKRSLKSRKKQLKLKI